tara:strand:- start:632 stop:997 length:366 start_codon:yes stop_codon:yes gene_type:complete
VHYIRCPSKSQPHTNVLILKKIDISEKWIRSLSIKALVSLWLMIGMWITKFPRQAGMPIQINDYHSSIKRYTAMKSVWLTIQPIPNEIIQSRFYYTTDEVASEVAFPLTGGRTKKKIKKNS